MRKFLEKVRLTTFLDSDKTFIKKNGVVFVKRMEDDKILRMKEDKVIFEEYTSVVDHCDLFIYKVSMYDIQQGIMPAKLFLLVEKIVNSFFYYLEFEVRQYRLNKEERI